MLARRDRGSGTTGGNERDEALEIYCDQVWE